MKKFYNFLCIGLAALSASAAMPAGTEQAAMTFTFNDSLVNKTVRMGIYTNGDFQIQFGDGELQTGSQSSYYTGTLTNIPVVKIYGNNAYRVLATNLGITKVDASNAPSLKILQLDNNQITDLTLNNNPVMTGIYAAGNRITNLTGLEGCTAMKVIDFSENGTLGGSFDLSQMSSLSKVDLSGNQVTAIVLPKTETLIQVYMSRNPISTLDVSNLSKLEELYCDGTRLTGLDLTGCTSLTTLKAFDAQLGSINLNDCKLLKGLYVQNNQLTSLDLTNNTAINWLRVEHNQLKTLNTTMLANLRSFMADYNELTEGDFGNNKLLTQLKISHNQLQGINVSNSKNLSWLKVDNNDIEAVDLSGNPYLYWLECDSNRIASLDVSHNTYLQWLACENNHLEALDIASNKGLQGLSIQGNDLPEEALNALIEQLPDVNSVKIGENSAAWCRQLVLSHKADDEIHIDLAQQKGWNVTEIVTTGINDVTASKAIASVKYVNLAGQQSDVPFDGMNIVVTTYTDGSQSAMKTIK